MITETSRATKARHTETCSEPRGEGLEGRGEGEGHGEGGGESEGEGEGEDEGEGHEGPCLGLRRGSGSGCEREQGWASACGR